MNNIYVEIIGSDLFSDIIVEIDLTNLIILKNLKTPPIDNHRVIKIIFIENVSLSSVQEYLKKKLPIVFVVKNKSFLLKNKLILGQFHVCLELPLDIFAFKEILNILITKYSFNQNSGITFGEYSVDSNQRTINKNNKKIKLTEKELQLILTLNEHGSLSKSSLLKRIWNYKSNLNSHAFETNLHRLRKKIYKSFKDSNFVYEKNSLYSLNK